MREECEHGSLKRSCQTCELQGEVALLKARLQDRNASIYRLSERLRSADALAEALAELISDREARAIEPEFDVELQAAIRALAAYQKGEEE